MEVRIGTRGSTLALKQTTLVADALSQRFPELKVNAVEIKTTGDTKQGTPRARQSDKRDWIAELEEAVCKGEIDCAVHSGKDVPAELAEGTVLLPLLPRDNAHDVFISRVGKALRDLPQGSCIGTASLRRKAQLLRFRPDFEIVEHRGNVPTRLRKLEESDSLAGIILAAAGLERLGLAPSHGEPLSPELMVPAVNQAMLVVQLRQDNNELQEFLHELVDNNTAAAFHAERACVERLEADCNSAVGIFATIHSGSILLRARVLSHDGQTSLEVEEKGNQPREVGKAVAEKLLSQGAARLLKEGSL